MSEHPISTVATPAHAGADRPPLPSVAPPGYELLDEVGRGGMGIVYRARDLALRRDVAVKVLRDEFPAESAAARRFLDEAFITGQLQHPGIPAMHQVGTVVDGRPFLAMKLIKGRALDGLLKERSDPSAEHGRFLAIFEQVCQAVGYAHAHAVIHRDLKPANVMVGAFGEVQVMDWGLAKVLTGGGAGPCRPGEDPDATLGTEIHSTRGEEAATQAGSLLGTPAYMAPEQAIGAVDQIDARSDVFGLGAILCVILTGKPPYVGADSESTRQLAARAKLDDAFARLDLCGAEPELVALAKRCLATEKADRPAGAGAVAAAVARLRADAEDRARQAELDRARAEVQAAEQRKRRKVQLALAGAVLLLVAGGGTFAWWADRQATARRVETENRERDERERLTRNSDAVAALLGQCEEALRGDDADKAALAWEQAEKRAAEGGADHLADRFARCRSDLEMLRELDRIDTFRWTTVNGKLPDPKQMAARWRAAFDRYGLVPGQTPVDEVAGRLAHALVQDRLKAALDLWLGSEPSPDVRAVLQGADPDSYRDAVRDAVAARDAAQVVELAGRPEALAQPPRFAAALGRVSAVPAERRRDVLRTALDSRPGDLALLMALGGSYPFDQRDGADERLRWFQAAVSAHPQRAVTHYTLGIALKDSGDQEGALASCKKAIQLDPKYAAAYVLLGNASMAKGDIEGGFTYYQEAVRLDPQMTVAQNNLGVALQAKGDFGGAIACYQEALRLNPKFATAHANMGDALRAKGDPDGAIAACKEALRIDPKFADAYVYMGSALRDKGDLDGAIAACKEAIRLAPKNADGYKGLAAILEKKGDLDGAIASYREAVRLEPREPHVRNSLGLVLKAKGDLDGAIESFREGARLGPKRVYIIHNLAAALRDRRKLEEAAASFREAIRLEPNRPNFHLDLGKLLQAQGDLDGAIAEFQEATRLDPSNARFHTALITALREKGDLDGAIAAYQGALRLHPMSPELHSTTAKILAEKGDRDGANAAYDAAIAACWAEMRLHPNNAGIAPRMRDCYVAKGDADGAVKAAQEAVRLYPNAFASHHGLGDALQFLKHDSVAAAAAYREAIRLNPKYAWSHSNLGTALRNIGDLDGAIAEFKEAVRLDPKHPAAQANLDRTLKLKAERDKEGGGPQPREAK